MTQAERIENTERVDDARDRGMTFVEVLVTIVLLGTIVLGILTAARTTVIASRTARAAAEVESALLTAAERVERADRDDGYLCDDFDGPVLAAAQLRFGIDAAEAPSYASVSYEHLNVFDNGTPSDPSDDTLQWIDGACPAGGYNVGLIQRISITMVSPDTGMTRTLQVVKSDV